MDTKIKTGAWVMSITAVLAALGYTVIPTPDAEQVTTPPAVEMVLPDTTPPAPVEAVTVEVVEPATEYTRPAAPLPALTDKQQTRVTRIVKWRVAKGIPEDRAWRHAVEKVTGEKMAFDITSVNPVTAGGVSRPLEDSGRTYRAYGPIAPAGETHIETLDGLGGLQQDVVTARSDGTPPHWLEFNWEARTVQLTQIGNAQTIRAIVAGANTGTAQTFPGKPILYTQGLGFRDNGEDHRGLGWGDTMLGPGSPGAAVLDAHSGKLDASFKMIVLTKARFSDQLVDESLFMTPAEVADPDHPNYKRNVGGIGADDGIAEILNRPEIDNGNGNTLVAVLATMTASAARNAVPQFILNLGVDYTFPRNGEAASPMLRFDTAVSLAYAKAYAEMWSKRLGTNKGVHSLSLGEYWPGRPANYPDGFTQAAHVQGAREIWRHLETVAPRDEDGNQLARLQANPMLESGVVLDDLISLNMGLGEPDIEPWHSDCGSSTDEGAGCEIDSLEYATDYLFGKVPVFGSHDNRNARNNRQSAQWGSATTYPRPADMPAEGETNAYDIRDVVWYRANVVKMDSLVFNTGFDSNGRWELDNLLEAFDTVARGGSESGFQSFPPPLAAQ